MPHLNNKQKYKPNHQQTGLSPHSALPIRGNTNKQTKTQHKSHLCEAHTNHWTNFVCVKSLSHVQLFATPWTVTHQAPLSMGFSRQDYWSGLPFPSPGIFPTQGSNPGLPHCRQTLYPLSHQGSSGPNLGRQKPKGR